jgi:hypothetical protein
MADTINSPAKLIKTVDYRDIIHYKIGGSVGTRHPRGTWQDPCGSLANVRTMLTARKLNRVWVYGAAILDADMASINWWGDIEVASQVNLNAFSVNLGVFHNLVIAGVPHAASVDIVEAWDCLITYITNPINLFAHNCVISTNTDHPLSGSCILNHCYATDNVAHVIMSYLSANNLMITNWRGDLTIQGIIAGAAVFIDGTGALSINGTGGTVTVRGDMEVTDLSAGAVTIVNLTSRATLDALQNLDDGIYYDSVNGVAGTDWPIGTAQNPSNTIANVITMCTARKVKKIYVSGALTLGATMQGYTFVGINKSAVITLGGQDISGSHFYNCTVTGAQGGAGYIYTHNCIIDAITGCAIYSFNDEFILSANTITLRSNTISYLTNPSSRSVPGWTAASVSFNGATTARIFLIGARGYFSARLSTHAANAMEVLGIGGCGFDTSAGNTAGSFIARGDTKFTVGGSGATETDLSLYASFNKIIGATGVFFEQPDAPFNIASSNAGELDIFDLTAANTQYIVRDMWLKCVDPGAETVTVRLYKLVNNAETLVRSFTITTLNYTSYFNLMDLFGVPAITGKNIRVCVIASAVGPYAVTGEYSYAKNNV